MTRRLFSKLFTSAALGTLCSFITVPAKRSAASEQITIYKGWIVKTSDFER